MKPPKSTVFVCFLGFLPGNLVNKCHLKQTSEAYPDIYIYIAIYMYILYLYTCNIAIHVCLVSSECRGA